MRTVRELLADGVSVQSVLGTMPERDIDEQREVWSVGLTQIAGDLARRHNRAAGRLIERVAEGQVLGLWWDPLDVAESYCRAELRRSRSREEGERKRQGWLLDVLVLIGRAREAGYATVGEHPDAETMRTTEPAAAGAP
jgi:hypothetical protein